MSTPQISSASAHSKRSDSKESQINEDDKALPIRSATLQSSGTAKTPNKPITQSDSSLHAPGSLADLPIDGSRKPRVLRKKFKKEFKLINTFAVKYKGQPISLPFSHNIELVNGTAEVLDHTVTPPLPILPRSPAPAPSQFVGKQGPCSPAQPQTPLPSEYPAEAPSPRSPINEPTGGEGSPSWDSFGTNPTKVHKAQSDGPQTLTSSANKPQPRDSPAPQSALQSLNTQHERLPVEAPTSMTDAPWSQRDRPMHTGDLARDISPDMGLATPEMPASPGGLYFWPTDILDDEGEDVLWYFGRDDPYREKV
jgi:hypothetical protein